MLWKLMKNSINLLPSLSCNLLYPNFFEINIIIVLPLPLFQQVHADPSSHNEKKISIKNFFVGY